MTKSSHTETKHPATKNNSSHKMFKFENSEVMSTTCHLDRWRATTPYESVLQSRATSLSPTAFQWWWLWRVIVHQHEVQWEWHHSQSEKQHSFISSIQYMAWRRQQCTCSCNQRIFQLVWRKQKVWLITQAHKCPSDSEKHARWTWSKIQTLKKQQPSKEGSPPWEDLGYGCPPNPGEDKMKNDRDLMGLTGFLGGGDKKEFTHHVHCAS